MIGVVGGTGLYQMDGLKDIETREVKTPFGPPSAPVVLGQLGGNRVAFLPRHGLHHALLPGEINFRANIWALKSVGVRAVIGISAVGSLAEEVHPGDLAIPTQYLDFTKGWRAHTFFGEGLVAHVSTAEPSCPALADKIRQTAENSDVQIHTGKTYACVEGPRLGNKAESHFLRHAGAHLVGMTNVPEVYLAREAQLCYCAIGVVTDYDCWLEDPSQHAAVDQVIALYQKNLGRVQNLLRAILTKGADRKVSRVCQCRSALAHAVLTREATLSQEKRELLGFLRE